jgi:MerR family transcriptional regulator, light-induced transcriptional regulator
MVKSPTTCYGLLISPRDLAEAVGVSESSVKRWADDGMIRVARTAGGHRRIELSEAVRFIRESGLPVVRPERLGIMRLEGEAGRSAADQAFRHALLDGSAERARAFLVSQYLSGASIAQICDGVVASAMHDIGELWKHDESGIVIEHRATDVCAQALNHLRALLPAAGDDAPVAVGGAPSGDPYMLASIAVAATLGSEGWRDINLGPQTPLEYLAVAAVQWHARLAWVSISVEEVAQEMAGPLGGLASRLAGEGVHLVVGGRASSPRLASAGRGIHVVRSLGELAAFARGIRSATDNADHSARQSS